MPDPGSQTHGPPVCPLTLHLGKIGIYPSLLIGIHELTGGVSALFIKTNPVFHDVKDADSFNRIFLRKILG